MQPGFMAPMPERTDHEIVEQTNKLARTFYRLAFGHTVGPEHRFYESDRADYHPQERMCWDMACAAQQELTNTDPDDAVANVEDA